VREKREFSIGDEHSEIEVVHQRTGLVPGSRARTEARTFAAEDGRRLGAFCLGRKVCAGWCVDMEDNAPAGKPVGSAVLAIGH
jgi:hypothetical protein